MKGLTKNILSLIALSLAAFTLLVLNDNLKKSTQHSSPLEITYKATSPFGSFGGTSLPASCESGVWNNNNGFHQDGVNADPGTCTITEPSPAIDGVCNPAINGVESASAPTGNLCDYGNATPVTSNGPWYWDCVGINKGKTVNCSAKVQNAKNDPPNTPTISGDMYAVKDITTSNWIEATDPESDDIFYELDWNCSGSIDGTTATYHSGDKAPIGHTYTAVGTYQVCGRAVQANDTSKKSGWGKYTIIVGDGSCKAPANACGVTSGTVVSGTCVPAPLPGGYGNTCSGPANSCGMTTIGTIGCDGLCTEKKAPNENLCPKDPTPKDPTPDPLAKTVINSFGASPKLIAAGKTSKLYWDISGDKNKCSITYTTNTNKTPAVFLASLPTPNGNEVTKPIYEKTFYVLTCGTDTREAVVSTYSLSEI